MLASIGVLLAAAAVTLPPSTDVTRPRLQIQIQVEKGVDLDASDVRAIASGIRAIWSPMLDVVVSLPGTPAPGAVDWVRLVITNDMLATRENTGLGWIGFVDGEPQPSITVSFAAAKRLAESGAWRGVAFSHLPPRASHLFFQRALAAASAHEVGHYLLRSRDHARKGLMRAVFTVDEIMDTRASLNRLDPEAAVRLRGGLKLARRDGDEEAGAQTRP